MIELFHEWNSVHSFKVRIVLAEKGVPWTDRRIELLKFEHLLPAYTALNPDGVVPTLVHEGVAILDSSPICEYLDEVFQQPALKPATAAGRARVRRWQKYHDEVVHAAMRDASFPLLYKPFLAAMPRAELEALLARQPRLERRRKFLDGANPEIDWSALCAAARACDAIALRVEAALQGSDWLEGAQFTLADVAMAPYAERIDNLGMQYLWDGRPKGAAWSQRILARASVRASLPPEPYRLPRPAAATIEELRRRLGTP